MLLITLLAIGQENPGQTLKKDSEGYSKRIYQTHHLESPPIIDGVLDDNCWAIGQWQSDYTQFTPNYSGVPSRRTDIKVLYGDKSVYVAIRAFENMSEITKRLGRRDNYEGDLVGVHFDSYFDHRTAYEFDITAAGQKLDVWVSNDGWDVNWNAVWNGKVAYEDSAWTAELEIPFSQLRYGSAPSQVWGFNSWRHIDKLQEEDHWNLVANDGTGPVYTFGELHGLEGIKKMRRIEMLPYLSSRLTSSPAGPGNTTKDYQTMIGLDAKIGVTNNLTLDLTINPDFGQVEADPSVLNLTAFEPFFEEKRPFFIEGKNIFEYSFDKDLLFYTRRIGHQPSYVPNYSNVSVPQFTTIGGAVKLSGKTANGLSIGILESLTLRELADIEDNNAHFQQVAEPLSNYFIGRVQKEYDKGNLLVGGILTHSHRDIKNDYLNFLSNDALTAGVDFTKYWKNRKYFFEFKTVGSHIEGDETAILALQTSSARFYQRPDAIGLSVDSSSTSLNGFGNSFKIGKSSKGHWRYAEEFVIRSAGLEFNDLGYMNLSNIMKNSTSVSFVELKNKTIFKTYAFNLLQQNVWNLQGGRQYALLSLGTEIEFMSNWGALFSGQYKFGIKDERLLRGGPAMIVPNITSYNWTLHSNRYGKLYFEMSGTYDQGESEYLKSISLAPVLKYRPWSNLSISAQPMFRKNVDALQYLLDQNLPAGTFLLAKVDNRNLSLTFRADLSITPELTIQYYGSPFVSIGEFSDFKEVQDSKASEYSDRFVVLNPLVDGTTYRFDSNRDGIFDYSINKPDFNYQQFRSNLVVRWEYKVGSAIFLAWVQDATAFEPAGSFDINYGLRNIFKQRKRNIFMVKFNHWFSI